jgi:acyl transferase domain-containing protein
MSVHNQHALNGLEVAVIGMSCRFPDADTLSAFWSNIKNGVESIRCYDSDELKASGIPQSVIDHPKFVPSGGSTIGKFFFDADFFGFSPRQAAAIDPHARVLLECTYHALEDAGFVKETSARVGLFLGASSGLVHDIIQSQEISEEWPTGIPISEFIASTLDLHGPQMMVDTACSASLVAIHLAARSVLLGECDIAIAGACALNLLSPKGYVYHDGLIRSIDGHCRAFDENATGTIGGEGAGVVVLKPLLKAISSNDNIHAVIKGSAINNDGNGKVGYTAPSVNGQVDAIKQALKYANVSSDAIEYVEAHGTATPLGDPIEIESLTRAYTASNRGTCAIGSVKANIGHLDQAAGVAGFIKTVLALKHKTIPPAVNFSKPNPKCSFDSSPFFVNTVARPWHTLSRQRRAGVSSFGIGGTNAHIILEEAVYRPVHTSHQVFAFLISANTITAVEMLIRDTIWMLDAGTDISLASLAYTSQIGRQSLAFRIAYTFSSLAELILKLKNTDTSRIEEVVHPPSKQQSGNDIQMLANLWIEGVAVDWDILYPEEKPRKVSLPAYPFARTEFAPDMSRLLKELSGIEALLTK